MMIMMCIRMIMMTPSLYDDDDVYQDDDDGDGDHADAKIADALSR